MDTDKNKNPNPKPQKGDLSYILNKANKDNISWTFWNYDAQGDGNYNSGVYNYKSVNENADSFDFGKKLDEKPNEALYKALKKEPSK